MLPTPPPPPPPESSTSSPNPTTAGLFKQPSSPQPTQQVSSSPPVAPFAGKQDELHDLMVFCGQVCEATLHLVQVPVSETLHSFSQRMENLFHIPRNAQIISVLESPKIVSYTISALPTAFATTKMLSTRATYLVTQAAPETASDTSPFRRQWVAFGCPANQRQPHDEFQDRLRQQLSFLLQDKTKHISLQVLSEMTDFSKASLSLWRRDLYRGNTLAIAEAVQKALGELAKTDYVYIPDVHRGICSNVDRNRRRFSDSVCGDPGLCPPSPPAPMKSNSSNKRGLNDNTDDEGETKRRRSVEHPLPASRMTNPLPPLAPLTILSALNSQKPTPIRWGSQSANNNNTMAMAMHQQPSTNPNSGSMLPSIFPRAGSSGAFPQNASAMSRVAPVPHALNAFPAQNAFAHNQGPPPPFPARMNSDSSTTIDSKLSEISTQLAQTAKFIQQRSHIQAAAANAGSSINNADSSSLSPRIDSLHLSRGASGSAQTPLPSFTDITKPLFTPTSLLNSREPPRRHTVCTYTPLPESVVGPRSPPLPPLRQGIRTGMSGFAQGGSPPLPSFSQLIGQSQLARTDDLTAQTNADFSTRGQPLAPLRSFPIDLPHPSVHNSNNSNNKNNSNDNDDEDDAMSQDDIDNYRVKQTPTKQ